MCHAVFWKPCRIGADMQWLRGVKRQRQASRQCAPSLGQTLCVIWATNAKCFKSSTACSGNLSRIAPAILWNTARAAYTVWFGDFRNISCRHFGQWIRLIYGIWTYLNLLVHDTKYPILANSNSLQSTLNDVSEFRQAFLFGCSSSLKYYSLLYCEKKILLDGWKIP